MHEQTGARPALRVAHGHRLFFAPPGNPVAAAVAFMQIVRCALLRLMGCRDTDPPLLPASGTIHPSMKRGRTEYQRGIMQPDEHGVSVSLAGPQGSAILGSLCQANCLVVLQHDRGDVAEGEWVDVMPLDRLL